MWLFVADVAQKNECLLLMLKRSRSRSRLLGKRIGKGSWSGAAGAGVVN